MTTQNKSYISGVLITLTAVCLFILSTQVASALDIGAKAPDFKLPGVDGKTYTLDSFKDADVLVVVFTCNHCPTSQKYESRIKKLVNDYKDKGVRLVAISPNDPEALRLDEMGYTDLDDTFASMKVRAEDREFNFPYLYAGDKPEVTKAYGATVTPEVFVLDKERKLRYQGRFDNSPDEEYVKTHDTRDAIDQLLAGKEVAVTWTRPFGCSVKWESKRESVHQATLKYQQEAVELRETAMEVIPLLKSDKAPAVRIVHFWSLDDQPEPKEDSEKNNKTPTEKKPEPKTAQRDRLLKLLADTDRMYRKNPILVVTLNIDAPERQDEVREVLESQYAALLNLQLTNRETVDSESDTPVAAPDRKKLVEAVGEKWDGQTPFTIVYTPQGKVVYKKQGPFDPFLMRKAVLGAVDEMMR